MSRIFEGAFNERIKNTPPSKIRKFFDLVVNTPGVISLGVGEPDFTTPWHIRESSFYSLEKGYTTYTSNKGLIELRRAISKYLTKYDVEYNPEDEVLVTIGVSEAVDLALRVLVDAGDEVLVPDPSYVSYSPLIGLAGGDAVPLKTSCESGFKITAEDLEAATTEFTKVLILTFPNNPTGAILTKEELEKLAEVIIRHDLIVISDEIYSELTYDGFHTSIASLPGMRERTILLNGFSKAYAMTGWRVGYACGPENVISMMNRIHQYSILCAPVMGQLAAVEALENGHKEMKQMVMSYNYRRNSMVNGFNKIGLECSLPQGAFYAFPSIKSTGMSSDEFAEKLLLAEKVAVVPGTAFGEMGEGYIRCCYAASLADINEAVKRMDRFLQGNRSKGDVSKCLELSTASST